MNVTFACPACEGAARLPLSAETDHLDCPHCGQSIAVPPAAVHEHGLHRCVICPSTDLFVRKDFPQRLGVALVTLGIVGSSIAWYGDHVKTTFAILFLTALADLALYLCVGDALMCYRCHAEYRQVDQLLEHGPFDLETHERHRQTVARLGQQART
jgi:NAD-dependent SIR2 family protein deacetylase